MSTFPGKIHDENLNFMCIDYFKPEVHSCSVFLLSHMHTDHMKGIFEDEFSFLLNNSVDKYLYCSPITRKFLLNHHRNKIRKEKIKQLDLQIPLIINDVVITCLPAKHCPGSIMILIEFNEKRILYTGDFRLTVQDIKPFMELVNNDGSPKVIHDVYLDTTFAAMDYLHFPTRTQSVETLATFIRKTWQKNPNENIYIATSANFGYEHVFNALNDMFRIPIHVHDNAYKYYSYIEQMDNCVTTRIDKDKPMIHACRSMFQSCFQCSIADDCRKKVKLSAMYFDKMNVNSTPFIELDTNQIRICYSNHCSLSELRQFISFLKPKRIIPLVKHATCTLREIVNLIICEDHISEQVSYPLNLFNYDKISSSLSLNNLKCDVQHKECELYYELNFLQP